jgi:tRNA threonylcarbamoyl adenosine modification protein YeaZ
LHVEMLSAAKRHDDDLLPAIDRAFRHMNLSPGDLTEGSVGVSIGPGGFTGLRIAASTAKMLAQSLNVKLAAVPTARVVAESCAGSGPMIVALASKKESCWCTRLERDVTGEWRVIGMPSLVEAASLDMRDVKEMAGDEHLPQAILERCRRKNVRIVRPAFDPAACLAVTERMIRAGQTISPLELRPLYARQPEAVILWDRKVGLAHPAGPSE